MSIDRLQAHYGFTRMPFSRDIAPQALHPHPAHREAIARIDWCVSQRQLGVITGEVGAGKTVAIRAALGTPTPDRILKIAQAFRVPADLIQARDTVKGGPLTTTESDGAQAQLQRYGAAPLRTRFDGAQRGRRAPWAGSLQAC